MKVYIVKVGAGPHDHIIGKVFLSEDDAKAYCDTYPVTSVDTAIYEEHEVVMTPKSKHIEEHFEAAIKTAISNRLKGFAKQIKTPAFDAPPEAWEEYWQERTEAIPLVDNPRLGDGEKKEYRIHCGECLQYYRLFINEEMDIFTTVKQDEINCPHCGSAMSYWIQLATHSAGWFNMVFTKRGE